MKNWIKYLQLSDWANFLEDYSNFFFQLNERLDSFVCAPHNHRYAIDTWASVPIVECLDIRMLGSCGVILRWQYLFLGVARCLETIEIRSSTNGQVMKTFGFETFVNTWNRGVRRVPTMDEYVVVLVLWPCINPNWTLTLSAEAEVNYWNRRSKIILFMVGYDSWRPIFSTD